MKRPQIVLDEGAERLLDMVDSLMMLSHPQHINHHHHHHHHTHNKSLFSEEVFKCKTCNREFTSFQALGGHRASHHKRQKRNDDGEKLKAHGKSLGLGMEKENKPKMHECSICGQRFSLGQALGGHMRKHRDPINEGLAASMNQVVVANVPVLKRSSSTRVMCLDLNLTPLENDWNLLFGTMAPQVNISF